MPSDKAMANDVTIFIRHTLLPLWLCLHCIISIEMLTSPAPFLFFSCLFFCRGLNIPGFSSYFISFSVLFSFLFWGHGLLYVFLIQSFLLIVSTFRFSRRYIPFCLEGLLHQPVMETVMAGLLFHINRKWTTFVYIKFNLNGVVFKSELKNQQFKCHDFNISKPKANERLIFSIILSILRVNFIQNASIC